MSVQQADNPHGQAKAFHDRLSRTEHTPRTRKIIEDFPREGMENHEWCCKQIYLLVMALRRARTPREAHDILSKLFDPGDQQIIGLRFYHLRWLLCAVQTDAKNPPFRDSRENFSFAKVAMIMRHRPTTPALKEFLLSLEESKL